MPLVECVPNFSEGRNAETLDALRAALTSVPGVRLLDAQADPSHNRSVFTLVGPPEAALEAAFRGVKLASERIDLRTHRGEHPRMGAADVVPFIPLQDVTMDDCVALAKRLGERVGAELGIPVFLYERAAARPERANLADVRKGEFEGLRDLIGTDPGHAPDFGPAKIHPTAGAVAIGARPFLVAYNVYLKTGDQAVAKAIAKKVRTATGGLPAVKALGMLVGGEAQVSMNLVDIDVTPPHVAFAAVAAAARELGTEATWSEIVGMVPERCVHGATQHLLLLREPLAAHVLENKVRATAGPTLGDWTDAVASVSPAPGGGTVSAVAGAMAAALAAMVGRLTVGRKKYAAVDADFRALVDKAEALRVRLMRLGDEDAAAFNAVSAAYALPKEPEAPRKDAIQNALVAAAKVPLETLRAAREVAALAARAAEAGNRNAVSDAGVGALLAGAAARGAAYNVRINVAGMPRPEEAATLAAEAKRLIAETEADVARATAAVEAAIGG
ncbi:MAG TPA: glutamate formimidoyltransferase [Gemmatimonadales bacterium]|nr:glutamate formimidoyltransferase [Gemmatimonadales bacterium]